MAADSGVLSPIASDPATGLVAVTSPVARTEAGLSLVGVVCTGVVCTLLGPSASVEAVTRAGTVIITKV